MNQIKNIIFDLGGVLLNLDYQLTFDLFAELGLTDVFSKQKQTKLFDELEEGLIDQETFLDAFIQASDRDISAKKPDILNAWNAILLDFPAERLTLLQQVKKNYKTYLYSNTNAIHMERFHEKLILENKVQNLDSFFDQVYFSHDLQIRKPKPEGFLKILDNHRLVASETLFIDDSIQHIQGAKKAGLHAEWLDLEKETIHDLLNRLRLI